jgi:acetolactate synthase-1/2/3 large subunit
MLSDLIASDMLNSGISVMFGVQGGACARIIDSFVAQGGDYVPVLNEQAAGYAAHGYFLKTKKIASVVVTTGPGLTNAVSGMASCYYDSIPILMISGQIKSTLNHAKIFKTKMVGFQELPHLDIIKPVCDSVVDIRSTIDYISQRGAIWSKLVSGQSSIFLEIQDDIQRDKCIVSDYERLNDILHVNLLESMQIQASNSIECDLIVLGSGAKNLSQISINNINNTDIPVILSWGGQSMASVFINFKGLFGTHTPGVGNTYFSSASCPIVAGASMLQHQSGRNSMNAFKSASSIIYINKEPNEISRFNSYFGKRSKSCSINADTFFRLNSIVKKDNYQISMISDVKTEEGSRLDSPPLFFSRLLSVFKKYGYCVFTDAGATLSWSYQGLNLLKPDKAKLEMYSSFNLHPMGFSNCALVGALQEESDDMILAIIGDGSLPMNCQELTHLQGSKRAKLVVLDNKGYGIIRLTQKEYFDGNLLGSDFNGKSKLPFFDVSKIIDGFGLTYIKTTTAATDSDIDNFFESNLQVLIVSCDVDSTIRTDFYS